MTHSLAPGLRHATATLRLSSNSDSSWFTAMRMAWKVLVAGWRRGGRAPGGIAWVMMTAKS
jgi:hypothetical protein